MSPFRPRSPVPGSPSSSLTALVHQRLASHACGVPGPSVYDGNHVTCPACRARQEPACATRGDIGEHRREPEVETLAAAAG